jgi:hypothetical protein
MYSSTPSYAFEGSVLHFNSVFRYSSDCFWGGRFQHPPLPRGTDWPVRGERGGDRDLMTEYASKVITGTTASLSKSLRQVQETTHVPRVVKPNPGWRVCHKKLFMCLKSYFRMPLNWFLDRTHFLVGAAFHSAFMESPPLVRVLSQANAVHTSAPCS